MIKAYHRLAAKQDEEAHHATVWRRVGLFWPIGSPPAATSTPKWTWTPEPLRIFFNTCYLSYVTQLTAQIATVLGQTGQDAAEYRRQAEAINRAVHAAYYDAKNAHYVNGEQPYQALALLTGTVPADLRAKGDGQPGSGNPR